MWLIPGLLAVAGLTLFGLGWAPYVRPWLEDSSDSLFFVRLGALLAGAAPMVFLFATAPRIPNSTVVCSCIAASLGSFLLIRAAGDGGVGFRLLFGPAAYAGPALGAGAVLGYLGLPAEDREGLLAAAPFAVALVLPLHVAGGLALERWVDARDRARDIRARIEAALDADETAPREILVRLREIGIEDGLAHLVWMHRTEERELVAPVELLGREREPGDHFVLEAPAWDERSIPSDEGYRDVRVERVFTGAERAWALGPSLATPRGSERTFPWLGVLAFALSVAVTLPGAWLLDFDWPS